MESSLVKQDSKNKSKNISEEKTEDYVFQRLRMMESSLISISKQLNAEILSRQQFQETSSKATEYLSSNFNILKNTFNHYDVEINRTFEKFHNEITTDISLKNNALLEYIREKEATKSENNGSLSKVQPLNLSGERFSSNIQKEFSEYRTELNSLIQRLNLFEINFEQKLATLTETFNNISTDITYIKSTINDIIADHTKTEYDLNTYKDSNDSKVKEINQKLEDLLNKSVENHTEIIKALQTKHEAKAVQDNKKYDEIENKIKYFHDDLNNKMRLLKETLINQLNSQNKEIDNFETHMITEHDKFAKLVRNNFEENVTKTKNIFDYTSTDVDLIRSKNNYIEKSVDKLREDIYQSIKDTEVFLLKKIQGMKEECYTN